MTPPIEGLVERLTAERDAAVYELKRFHEVRDNAPDWERLWAEQTEAREAAEVLVERQSAELHDTRKFAEDGMAAVKRESELRIEEAREIVAYVNRLNAELVAADRDHASANAGYRTRMEAKVLALTTALEPFANLDMPAADKWTCGTFLVEHADIRRARAALEQAKP